MMTSLTFKAIHSVCLCSCLVCQWLYLFSAVNSSYSVLCTPPQPRPILVCQWKVKWNKKKLCSCCPWCLMLMASLDMRKGRWVGREAALSAIWHCRFTFQRSSRTSVWLPLREKKKHCYVSDEWCGSDTHMQHRLVIVLFVLVRRLPRRISADILPFPYTENKLLARSQHRTWSACVILSSAVVPNHVLFNYRNLCICATCVHVFDAAVPPLVNNL